MSRKDRAPRARKPRELKRALRLSPEEIARDENALALLARWAERDGRAARLHAKGEAAARRRAAEAALRLGRWRDRHPVDAVRRVLDEVAGRPGGEPSLGDTGWPSVVRHLAECSPRRRFAQLARLLGAVASRTRLLHRYDRACRQVLLHLSKEDDRWLRAPEGWRPPAGGGRAQLSSLIAWLRARYPVPRPFELGYFRLNRPEWRRWYAHVGEGCSLRSAERLPFPLSRRAAGFALQAPGHFDPDDALRYGQVRAEGAGHEQALAMVRAAWLGLRREDEPFWLEVFRWLIRHPELPTEHYDVVLDWLDEQRHAAPPGAEGAPQPNLSMRGRCPEATLRTARAWREAVHGRSRPARREWAVPDSLRPWRHLVELGADVVEHALVPLTDTGALLDEGRRMKHCVGDYVDACAAGDCSIVSLRRTSLLEPGTRRLATVEVRGGRVVQARAACNESPTEEAFGVLARWASERGVLLKRRRLS